MLISHDSHLVESVADRLWLVDEGTITPFDEDMDGYRSWLIERARKAASETRIESGTDNTGRKDQRRDRAEQRRTLAPLRKVAKAAEQLMEQLGKERAKIETRLADPALYEKSDASEITKLNTRLAALIAEEQAAEERWLNAEAEIELANQS